MVSLSLEAGELVALVLNAIQGLLLFYQRDVKELNLDSLFGLRVIQGQMEAIRRRLPPDTAPPQLLQEMDRLARESGAAAEAALPYTQADSPAYFDSFRFMVEQAYDVWGEPQLTSAKLLWPLGGGLPEDERDSISEAQSDECIGQLLKAPSLRGHTVDDHSACPGLSRECRRRMLEQIGLVRYSLTHQILYTSVAVMVNCSSVLDAHLKRTFKRFRRRGLEDWRQEWCSNLHLEMEAMWSENGGGSGNWASHYHKDLFMEQIFTCGQFGFSEFAERRWMEAVLSWQAPNGCFAMEPAEEAATKATEEEEEGRRNPVRAEMRRAREEWEAAARPDQRRLLMEKVTNDGCGGHVNAVAAGALTIFLRFLLLPGDRSMGHIPIQLSPSERPLKPWPFLKLEIGLWGLRSHGLRAGESLRMMVEPKPPASPTRDVTGYFLLILIAVFAYATWRLFARRRRALNLYPYAYKKL